VDGNCGWYELVPIASWLVQRGRCRQCGARIGVEALLVERSDRRAVRRDGVALSASSSSCRRTSCCAPPLVVLSGDRPAHAPLAAQIIYARRVVGATDPGRCALVHDDAERIRWSVVGAAGALAFFLLLYFGWKGAMGDGDVALGGAARPLPRLDRPMHVPVGLFLGFVAGPSSASSPWREGAGRKDDARRSVRSWRWARLPRSCGARTSSTRGSATERARALVRPSAMS
jgi:leader peptidase (prepilin peptidase)/N-methyltransferase